MAWFFTNGPSPHILEQALPISAQVEVGNRLRLPTVVLLFFYLQMQRFPFGPVPAHPPWTNQVFDALGPPLASRSVGDPAPT